MMLLYQGCLGFLTYPVVNGKRVIVLCIPFKCASTEGYVCISSVPLSKMMDEVVGMSTKGVM